MLLLYFQNNFSSCSICFVITESQSTFVYLLYRYDYEDCDAVQCNLMMADLEKRMNQSDFIGSLHEFESKSFQVAVADNFSYTDPIDGSLSVKQVTIIF